MVNADYHIGNSHTNRLTVIYVDPETQRSYTYAQVKKTAIEFGKGLRGLWDWQKGDVLASYTPNSIDFPAIVWGTIWAGGIVSPANPAYNQEELAFQLKDSGAKALVTQTPFLPQAQAACKIAGIPNDRIIVLGDERAPNNKHFTGIQNISRSTHYLRTKAKNPEKDVAFLVYSSGTTGHPKGVMLSHRNIVSNILMLSAGEAGNLSPQGGPDGKGDRLLTFLPFFHIYGLTCVVHYTLYAGLKTYVMAKFELERFCQIVQDYKIAFAYVVPPVVLGLAKSPIVGKYDLSSIRMINSGAAPLTHEIVDALFTARGLKVKQGYGLSETSPTTHTQPWEDWQRTVGSIGRLLPNQVAKFVGPDEKELPAGETGELYIKGPNVFLGYLNNEAGTKNALTDDGFFRTGDIGHMDKEGNFYITDRAKELIKYKGFQVPPAELEGVLASHPDIDDVCVIGIYDASQATEVPRAYVVPRKGVPGTPETEKKIVDWMATKVAGHKKLRGGVKFIDAVPKTVSGKILRRVLKEQAKADEQKAKL